MHFYLISCSIGFKYTILSTVIIIHSFWDNGVKVWVASLTLIISNPGNRSFVSHLHSYELHWYGDLMSHEKKESMRIKNVPNEFEIGMTADYQWIYKQKRKKNQVATRQWFQDRFCLQLRGFCSASFSIRKN